VLICGTLLLPIGATAFVLLAYVGSIPVAAAGSLIMGMGMGFSTTAAIVMVQSSVGWAERGAATASNIFSRNLGSTLGAAAFGGVFNMSLAQGDGHAVLDIESLRRLLDHGAALPEAALRAALAQALNLTFFAMLAVALLTFVLSIVAPRVALEGKPEVPVPE
jgi:MFS family permease